MALTVSFPTLMQDRFASALLGVCEVAGGQGSREPMMAPLLALLCRRLYRVMDQVNRVLARMQAGKMPARRRAGAERSPSARPQAAGPARLASGGLRLRYGWAWMIRMAPRAAQYAPQVQLLLDDLEMQAALAASPSLRRAVRPLCRGLAFPTPAVLRDTRRPKRGTSGGVAEAGVSSEDVSASGDSGTEAADARYAAIVDAEASRFVPPSAVEARSPDTPCRDACDRPNGPPPPRGRDWPRWPSRLSGLFSR